jgi:hypothetical protein
MVHRQRHKAHYYINPEVTDYYVSLFVYLCGTITAKNVATYHGTIIMYSAVLYRTAYGTVRYCMVAYRTVRYGTVPGTPRSGATGVQKCSARSAANKSDVTNTAPRDAS